MSRKNVLLLTPFFSPNIGGVETHLDDVVQALDAHSIPVRVLSYSPITTPGMPWKAREERGRFIRIRRFRWFGKTLFHKLESRPLLDFLYLTPYLGLRAFLHVLLHPRSTALVHAQGFNAACIGLVLKFLFRKPLIVSSHAVYEMAPDSRTAKLVRFILNRTDKVLCVSDASLRELRSFGVDPAKLAPYRYWLDLDAFSAGTAKARETGRPFTVLFVGRFIEKKGARVLCQAARELPDIRFQFVGSGPEEEYLRAMDREHDNIELVGQQDNKALPRYYQAADVLCIPSQYEEGFGRVVMEAVACGLPVLASNRGGLPEALDESVAVFVEPTKENLVRALAGLRGNPGQCAALAANCRAYAEEHFSIQNAETILAAYKQACPKGPWQENESPRP